MFEWIEANQASASKALGYVREVIEVLRIAEDNMKLFEVVTTSPT